MDGLNYVNTIIAPKSTVYITPIILIIFFVIIFIAFLGIIYSVKNITIIVDDANLTIKSVLYGKKIPIDSINADGIRVINLNENKEYDLVFRTNGISLPNFKSGWMRLKNKEKALVFITDRTSVVLIPTKDYPVLFSMDNVDGFIKAIKQSIRSYPRS
jgi:hypothetical protein